MTTFILIRHAEYDGLGSILAGRAPGIRLNEAGGREALALAGRLGELPISAVISSPLERTLETAAPLAARLGLAPIISEALLELDFGDWQGRPFAELHDQAGWLDWNKFRSGTLPPGGESMLDAQARIVRALLGWRLRYGAAAVALVSHSDLIKAALAYFLAAPLDLFGRIELRPASASILELETWGARLLLLNHTGRIRL